MPKRQRYMSRKGVDPKFLRNQKYCVKGIRRVTDGEEKKAFVKVVKAKKAAAPAAAAKKA